MLAEDSSPAAWREGTVPAKVTRGVNVCFEDRVGHLDGAITPSSGPGIYLSHNVQAASECRPSCLSPAQQDPRLTYVGRHARAITVRYQYPCHAITLSQGDDVARASGMLERGVYWCRFWGRAIAAKMRSAASHSV